MRFAMIYRAGRNYDPDLSSEDPGVMRDHVALMGSLRADGVMLLGGPFLDGPGGMSVLDLADREAAKAIADADPAVQGGHFEVEIREWRT